MHFWLEYGNIIYTVQKKKWTYGQLRLSSKYQFLIGKKKKKKGGGGGFKIRMNIWTTETV